MRQGTDIQRLLQTTTLPRARYNLSMSKYDALLLVSFGGPEQPADVIPFLENVLRGKNVPRDRMLEVAEHYQRFGGVSPINQQNRELIKALRRELADHGPNLPIYWGNRNWHPMLPDTMASMRADGIRRALAFVTSAFSCYSGCRQYREDIERARAMVGPDAPQVDKIRVFFNHPGFITAMADRVVTAVRGIPPERWRSTRLVFTAHSIPLTMAEGCDYVQQLQEAARLVTAQATRDLGELAGGSFECKLVYQSRSGPPTQPWLEPDVCDYLRELAEQGGVTDVVLVPIGFVSDHMEVLFDLDTEAADLGRTIGLHLTRAGTAGTHPAFVRMVRELILERETDTGCQAWGSLPPRPHDCREGCCPSGRPSVPAESPCPVS